METKMENAQPAGNAWVRPSTWLVALMGIYMLVNTVRAFADPAGFATAMGLPLTDPSNYAFVQVYALRALFLGTCAIALLWSGQTRALSIFALVAVLMPIGDALLTASNGAPVFTVARHAATAIVLAITAALLARHAARQAGA
jgi:uncharacterized membrane protein